MIYLTITVGINDNLWYAVGKIELTFPFAGRLAKPSSNSR